MEIKLPPALEEAIQEELEYRSGQDKRHFVLEAIRQHCARCKGNRERVARERKARDMAGNTENL